MNRAVSRAAVLATAATLTVGAAVAVTGAASAAPAAKFSTRATGAVTDAATKSRFLAGYYTPTVIRRVTATFKLPSLTCGSDTQGIALGVGNEQTKGAPTVLADAFAYCSGGAAGYLIDALAGGNDNQNTAAAGDTITVTIVQSSTAETATVNNVTQGVSATSTGTPTPDNAVLYGAFPLFVGTSTPIDVPNFGHVQFSKNLNNGRALKLRHPQAINRQAHTTLQIQTGAFNGAGAFRLNFKSSS